MEMDERSEVPGERCQLLLNENQIEEFRKNDIGDEEVPTAIRAPASHRSFCLSFITAVCMPMCPSIGWLIATFIFTSNGVVPAIVWSLLLFPGWCALLEMRMRRTAYADDSLLLLGLSGVIAGVISWLRRLALAPASRALALAGPALLLRSILRCRLPHPARSCLDSPAAARLSVGDCRWCGQRRRRLDHHCLWLNACIHAGTHADFITALALAAASAASFAAVTLADLAAADADAYVNSTEQARPWADAAGAAHSAGPWDFALALCVAAVGAGVVRDQLRGPGPGSAPTRPPPPGPP